MAVWNAFNDPVQTEAAKVVGHLSDGVVGWIEAQQLRQKRTHFLIIEPTQLETEYNQDGEQGLHAIVAKAYLGGKDLPVRRVFARPSL